MDVSIFVETTFDDGESRRGNIGRHRRAPDELGTANLGLLLDEAKQLLGRLQEAILQEQIDEALSARRKCNDCGRRRAIHVDRGRIFNPIFGRFRVKSLRIRQCSCQSAGVEHNRPEYPYSGLFPDQATPELRRLQAELGSRHLCHVALRTLETAALMPSWACEINSFTPHRPRRVSLRRNSVQIGSASEAPTSRSRTSRRPSGSPRWR
jgi:hypothetical protein